jgi:hypothetical protein
MPCSSLTERSPLSTSCTGHLTPPMLLHTLVISLWEGVWGHLTMGMLSWSWTGQLDRSWNCWGVSRGRVRLGYASCLLACSAHRTLWSSSHQTMELSWSASRRVVPMVLCCVANRPHLREGWELQPTHGVACFIKPKSQMGISYPPNLVHILILLGFAKRIKFLAVPEVRPNLTSISAKNTKDFQNLEREKISNAF